MPITTVESENNPRWKRWKRLANEPRQVKKTGLTLAEGAHLAEVFHDLRPELVESVIISEKASEEGRHWAGEVLAKTRAPGFLLKADLYQTLSPVEHGVGVMLELRVPQTDLEALDWNRDVLYLDGVQDAGNAGTLIRTALAAGVGLVCASPSTVNLWSPKVLRAGMGAHASAEIVESIPVEEFRARFPGLICAADARGGEDLFAAEDYTRGPVAWVMGAEGPGVSAEALALRDHSFYISIEPACESLNVGAAAAVCLFDMRRRRLARA